MRLSINLIEGTSTEVRDNFNKWMKEDKSVKAIKFIKMFRKEDKRYDLFVMYTSEVSRTADYLAQYYETLKTKGEV